MKISKRLKAIAELVENNSYIIDVGCDHALLDIFLVNNKKNIKALATDIKKEPLLKAQENINKYNIKDIVLKQSDGISDIDSKVDTIILSGLGTTTILDILFKDKNKLSGIKNIIISSNNDYYLLRKTMQDNNYKIKKEIIINDKNKYYPIIKYSKGKSNYNKYELEFGPMLIKEKCNDFIDYLDAYLLKLKEIRNRLPKKYIIKKYKLQKKIRVVNRIKL